MFLITMCILVSQKAYNVDKVVICNRYLNVMWLRFLNADVSSLEYVCCASSSIFLLSGTPVVAACRAVPASTGLLSVL
jgi:hypothetical protein